MGYATRIDGAWCFPACLCKKEGYGAPYRIFEALRRTLGLQYFVFFNGEEAASFVLDNLPG